MGTQAQDSRYLTELKPSLGKGMGLFAVARIPRGTRVLAEPALLLDHHGTPLSIMRAFHKLHPSQQTHYLRLHSYISDYSKKCWEEFIPGKWEDLPELNRKVMEIFAVNQFDEGVFLRATRLNHSCVPNLVHTYNTETKLKTFHTVRDVAAGEELTISYCGGCLHTWSERREFLDNYGFVCTCEACEKVDGGKKPDEREAWVECKEQLISNVDDRNWPRVLVLGKELAGVLEAAGFYDGSLSFVYHEIARAYFKLDDLKSALIWAEKKHGLERFCIGDDHAQSKLMGEVVKHLKAAVETSGPPTNILLDWADMEQE